MAGTRLALLLGGCLLTASVALADDVGFINCHEHPELTQVFAKARQTHETVATLPCGERFTILLYGFIFSRIQTRDGQVGYVFSNAISVDHSGTPVLRPSSTQLRAGTSNVPAAAAPVAEASPAATAKPQAPIAEPMPTVAPTPEHVTKVRETNTAVVPNNLPLAPQARVTPIQPAPTPAAEAAKTPEVAATVAQPEATPAPAAPAASPAVSAPETSASAAQPTSTIFPRPVTAPVEPNPAPEPVSSAPETSAAVAQPNPPAATEAEPAPAIRAVNASERWEKPNRGTHRAAVLEFFGGYGFTRLDGGSGTMTNLNGALGSFGWNVRPWLQLVADTSYNFVTASGTKNVLYGNHWGPRLFFHGRYPWGAVPFVEGLVGGSRVDTTVSGVGGYKTSDNCLSFKVGGGLDIHPSRHFKIRVFDFDYYRTAFGANLHQNNYSASVGIVLRLFGGGSE
jgi:hypothetical protein